VLGLHATPVLFGRTEPPGRLPSCARLPLGAVGLPRLSPRLSGFRRGFFSPHGSRPPVGLSANLRGRSSTACSGMHATPARKVSSRTSWPPSSPAPGSLRHLRSGGRAFQRVLPRIPARRFESSRIHELARAISAVYPVAALHVLWSARYPCPLRQDRAPWPPSLLRQAPTRRRRASSPFPAAKRFPTRIL
jgi:hypothetical protein